MKTFNKLTQGLNSASTPVQAIAGALLGLAYIIMLPFAGLACLVVLGGYRIKQSFAVV